MVVRLGSHEKIQGDFTNPEAKNPRGFLPNFRRDLSILVSRNGWKATPKSSPVLPYFILIREDMNTRVVTFHEVAKGF
jgi:hypothetical protein